jgi:lipopolysaccharide export system permease protein
VFCKEIVPKPRTAGRCTECRAGPRHHWQNALILPVPLTHEPTLIGTTLQRMIFWELLRVFLLALCAITGLFTLGGVIQEASQRGLTPPQILQVLPLLLPSTLPYTVPATVLFATCVVYGRMSHDHEITALRAAGVHLGRLLVPAVIFALLVTSGLGIMYYEVIPSTRQKLAERVLADVDQLIFGMLKRHGCIRHQKLPFAMFVRDVRGDILIEPVFKRRSADGSYGVVAHAKEAKLWTDLHDDKVYIFMPHCAVAGSEADGNLRDQKFEVSFPVSTFRDTQVRPMNMTWRQILAKQEELAADRARREAEIQELQKRMDTDAAGREVFEQLKKDHEFHIKESKRTERFLRAEKNMRPVLALGGLFFAIIAFPVGVWFHRADYLSTFVTCFLPVVLIYYPLVLAGNNLAKEGRLPASISVWMADVTAAIVGYVMVRKLFRQ